MPAANILGHPPTLHLSSSTTTSSLSRSPALSLPLPSPHLPSLALSRLSTFGAVRPVLWSRTPERLAVELLLLGRDLGGVRVALVPVAVAIDDACACAGRSCVRASLCLRLCLCSCWPVSAYHVIFFVSPYILRLCPCLLSPPVSLLSPNTPPSFPNDVPISLTQRTLVYEGIPVSASGSCIRASLCLLLYIRLPVCVRVCLPLSLKGLSRVRAPLCHYR